MSTGSNNDPNWTVTVEIGGDRTRDVGSTGPIGRGAGLDEGWVTQGRMESQTKSKHLSGATRQPRFPSPDGGPAGVTVRAFQFPVHVWDLGGPAGQRREG